MDLQLAGDTAIVFGAARGLGLAIATAFAHEGCRIVLTDVSPTVHDAARTFAEARSHVLDVTDYPAVCATVEEARREFGRIDHAVFAVAVASGKFGFPFWNLEPSDWDRVLKVNLIGAANVAHALAPSMTAARRGTVLFISSVAGQVGSQTDPPYSASKAGLINFMQCAAKDLAPFGVRVNALCPGMVKTELARSVWQAWADRQPPGTVTTYDDWAAEKIQRMVPLNRWQTPEDVAAMAVFLASPRAGNVTGQTVNVDGGYVMR
jgi:2-hydroxycyclohexanecarboxyl-CoA dehydrogenase